jgi:hypothetical protein
VRTSRSAAVTLLAFVTWGLVVACGIRGPLDVDPAGGADDDDDDGGATSSPEASTGTAESDAAAEAAAPPIADAGREAEAAAPGPLQCAGCLLGSCGEGVIACLTDQACRDTFQCVVTDCLAGGGGLDFQCVTGCVSDLDTAVELFAIVQCVTGTCGTNCGGVLPGGFPGLPGGP